MSPSLQPTLGQPYNKTIQQRMKGKQERRQLYADIDLKRTQRFGTLCSAFQALQMPVSINQSSVHQL